RAGCARDHGHGIRLNRARRRRHAPGGGALRAQADDARNAARRRRRCPRRRAPAVRQARWRRQSGGHANRTDHAERVPDRADASNRLRDAERARLPGDALSDGASQTITVAIEPDAIARVARLTRRELPASGPFWQWQARRLLSGHLWTEGRLPQTGRLTLRDVPRDDLELAGAWAGE